MNIFGFHFFDKYEYIWVYQKWENMNTNTIIRTDIRDYEYEYKYYCTQNLKDRYVYGYESYKCRTIIAHMFYKIQYMVLGLKE